MLKQALTPALARLNDLDLTSEEFERLGVEDYRRAFGHAISTRHWSSTRRSPAHCLEMMSRSRKGVPTSDSSARRRTDGCGRESSSCRFRFPAMRAPRDGRFISAMSSCGQASTLSRSFAAACGRTTTGTRAAARAGSRLLRPASHAPESADRGPADSSTIRV